MRKILEERYRGNINPTVKQFHRGTQYDEALRCMCKNQEKLEDIIILKSRIKILQSKNGMRGNYE